MYIFYIGFNHNLICKKKKEKSLRQILVAVIFGYKVGTQEKDSPLLLFHFYRFKAILRIWESFLFSVLKV